MSSSARTSLRLSAAAHHIGLGIGGPFNVPTTMFHNVIFPGFARRGARIPEALSFRTGLLEC